MKPLLFLLLSATVLCGQTVPAGDIYQSGTPGGTVETPQAAYSKLYQLAAQIVQDPANGYQPPPVDDWPAISAAKRDWYNSMIAGGVSLTASDRDRLVPGADHLMTAISDMERGYRIHITQKTWAAQQSAKKLYAEAQAELAMCNSSGATAEHPADTASNSQSTSSSSDSPAADALTPQQVGQLYKLHLDLNEYSVQPLPPGPTDMVGDHLLRGFQDWVDSTMKMLEETPGRPLNDISNAIANYLTNNTNKNNATLKAAAEKAAQQFEDDPARMVGMVAPNFLPLPKVKALQQLGRVEAAAEEVVTMEQAEQKFANAWNPNKPTPTPPPLTKPPAEPTGTPPAEPNGTPPAEPNETPPAEPNANRPVETNGLPPAGFAQNACFKTALAQDALWKSGETYKIAGVQVTDRADLTFSNNEITEALADRFPDAGSESSVFTPTEQRELATGSPILSTPQQIGDYIRSRGGNQGLVFVDDAT